MMNNTGRMEYVKMCGNTKLNKVIDCVLNSCLSNEEIVELTSYIMSAARTIEEYNKLKTEQALKSNDISAAIKAFGIEEYSESSIYGKLPYEINTLLYVLQPDGIYEMQLLAYNIYPTNIKMMLCSEYLGSGYVDIKDIGNIVFETSEEAEIAYEQIEDKASIEHIADSVYVEALTTLI